MSNESKHTPGPWKRQTPTQIVGHRGRLVARILDTRPADGANARLIAAAPRMLAVLQRIEESCAAMVERGEDCDPYDMAEAALNECRAVIAEATGEATP